MISNNENNCISQNKYVRPERIESKANLLIIKLKMDKKSDMGSSIYFSDKAMSMNSQKDSKRKTRATNYRIEVVNQNLEDAIKEVRANVKENPQWHLKVEAVSSQYSNKKKPMPVINQSHLERPGINFLPQSHKQPQPTGALTESKIDFQGLKFTERMKREYLQRIKYIKEKRMQLQVVSLEKTMKAKLQRKIKENTNLKEKARLIKDIQQRREDKMRLTDHQHFRKRQQQSLLHETNIAKVEMLRRNRRKSKKSQLSQCHSQSEISKMQHKFKQLLMDKEKQERKELLVTRYRMIRTASQRSVRTRAQVRQIQTSQSTKRLGKDDFVHY